MALHEILLGVIGKIRVFKSGRKGSKENTLVKPKLWEDTFENFILKSKVRHVSGEIKTYNYHERMYGQCWTLESSSDAMWRIYSPNKEGIRIRTTIGQLLNSIYSAQETALPDAHCCIGKVEYLKDKKLMERANSTFDETGILVGNIFRSLLMKRLAFKHENEVRLIYDAWDEEITQHNIYKYDFKPHENISQIMIDPRRSYDEFKSLEKIIRLATGFKGEIKRSLLYQLPKDTVLDVTNDFNA